MPPTYHVYIDGSQFEVFGTSGTAYVYSDRVVFEHATLPQTWYYTGSGTFLGFSSDGGTSTPDAGMAVGDSFTYYNNMYYWSVASSGGGTLTVTYNGSTIHTASATGSATLNTAGKYMEGDVSLSYTFDGGGGGGGSDAEDAIIAKTISGSYENSRVTTIGSYAFYNCASLTAVSFPLATTISSAAFYTCYSLTIASFPSATTIGNSAFGNCASLTAVSFPLATTIVNFAFYNCSRLTTASFPLVTTIGNAAFYSCYSLTIASFPSVTTIGNSAFYNCIGIRTASFPSATTIGSSAFYGCYSLTTVSFPLATTIGNSAFYNCNRLTTASFPSVTTIGNSAFYRCSSLVSLYLLGSSVAKLSTSYAFISTPIGGYTTYAGRLGSIYVPASLYDTYKASTNWTYFSLRFVSV